RAGIKHALSMSQLVARMAFALGGSARAPAAKKPICASFTPPPPLIARAVPAPPSAESMATRMAVDGCPTLGHAATSMRSPRSPSVKRPMGLTSRGAVFFRRQNRHILISEVVEDAGLAPD